MACSWGPLPSTRQVPGSSPGPGGSTAHAFFLHPPFLPPLGDSPFCTFPTKPTGRLGLKVIYTLITPLFLDSKTMLLTNHKQNTLLSTAIWWCHCANLGKSMKFGTNILQTILINREVRAKIFPTIFQNGRHFQNDHQWCFKMFRDWWYWVMEPIYCFILYQNHQELHNDIGFDVYNIIWWFKMAAKSKMATDSIKCFKW